MNNTNKINKLKSAMLLAGKASLIGFAAVASVPSMADKGDAEVQIVGGVESTPYSRPYQVALLMNGRQGCGGTLISPQWVLTAAHCLDSASTSSLTVKVGAHRMSSGDGTTHRVSQITKHEYWRGAQSIQSGYDIAVLRLSSPVSSSITPASLPSVSKAGQIAGVGASVTVSGWGTTYSGGSPSDALREVSLPVMNNSSCSSALGVNVGSGVICGDGPNGTSACNGDSGGPYAVQSGGKYYSIGTVSWGKSCRGATAFTRTSAYLDWIEQKTGVTPDDGTTTDLPPTARFSASTNELTVSLSNSSTDDIGISGYQWTFGDGSSSTQTNPSHTYAQAGSYTVTLRVTDTKGQTDDTARSITVSASDNCLSVAETKAAWSASVMYSIGDKVSHNGKDYEATWWSQGATPSIYTNVWKVIGDSDGNGDGNGDGDNCGDENQAPVANFSASTTDLTANFSNSSTDDNGISSYSWNFGDGYGSYDANPSHTYATEGSYTVSLTVTDAEGESDTTSRVVTVSGGDVVEGCDGVAAWSGTTSYVLGDTVAYNGYKYEAIWWSTGAKPDVFSNVWSNKGACSQ